MNFYNTDITRIKSDCIINPANGLGVMHKGVSRFIQREGGPEVLNSSKEACFYHGLYKPGEAYIAKSGFLEKRGIKAIIHAVTVYRHPSKTKLADCPVALRNAIQIAEQQGYESISVPSFGIEPRNINESQSARMVIDALITYENDFEFNVVDTNKEFIEACERFYKLKVKK